MISSESLMLHCLCCILMSVSGYNCLCCK